MSAAVGAGPAVDEAPLDWRAAGATLLTMDAGRRVVEDGYLAVRGDCIVAVGKREALDPRDRQAHDPTTTGATNRGERIAAWPLLVGRSTHTDTVWQAAKQDARRDPRQFPAPDALTMATPGGARALQPEHEIGAPEVGKKADSVAHDIGRFEGRPLVNVVDQLVGSADGRGVQSVCVDGVRVVEDYRSTRFDEDEMLARAQRAGEGVARRSGLPLRQPWPVA